MISFPYKSRWEAYMSCGHKTLLFTKPRNGSFCNKHKDRLFYIHLFCLCLEFIKIYLLRKSSYGNEMRIPLSPFPSHKRKTRTQRKGREGQRQQWQWWEDISRTWRPEAHMYIEENIMMMPQKFSFVLLSFKCTNQQYVLYVLYIYSPPKVRFPSVT